MSIPIKRVARVVIAGQWHSIKPGEFEVVEMEFTGDDGAPVHAEPLETPAYRFLNDNGDLYYGPLSAIELYKLMDI